MRKRSAQNGLILYILLNIVVSAATTLAVMVIWDRVKQSEMPPQLANVPIVATNTAVSVAVAAATPVVGPVIEINQVIGAGDPQQEYVLLKRVGEGDLNLAGWKLEDQHGNAYTFQASSELVLFKGGSVTIYTRVGADTPTEIYWNRTDPVWKSGEKATLLDSSGKVQATYVVP